MSLLYFKIVRKEGDDIKTLHRGINGSRVLPINKWITAQRKVVKDSPNGTPYECGLHILKSREVAESYLKHFKKKEGLIVVPCHATGLRRKTHSRHEVFMANKVYIIDIKNFPK